jgi:hypothetical protein
MSSDNQQTHIKEKKFTFSRDELQELSEDFLEILKSPEAIQNEWINLDGYAGNGIVSLAELELWLCIRFPKLRHTVAIRMTFYRILKLSGSTNGFIQKQAMYNLLVTILCSNQSLLWWNELPSKSADEILAWLASKQVRTFDERMSLENTGYQLAPNTTLMKLQLRVAAAVESNSMFPLEFTYFCDLMASFKTTQIDILYCNLQPCHSDAVDLSAKPRMFSDVQKRIRSKVIQETRAQDHLSASSLPYMKTGTRCGTRPSTSCSQKRPSTSHSAIFSIRSPSEARDRPQSTDSMFLSGTRSAISGDGDPVDKKRPTTSSESVLSLLTGRTSFGGSLETCESIGEIVPGILYAKNVELTQSRKSYLKAFGLQHPHTGTYFHSHQHNDLMSETQVASLASTMMPQCSERLNQSPLKSPTFKLMRNKPGSNPLAFSTERSPSKFDKDLRLAMHPRRPWNCEFASFSNTNGSFSMSSSDVASAKNRHPVTRALSPTSALLLSPAAILKHGSHNSSNFVATKGARHLEWDSTNSPLGYFQKDIPKFSSFAKTSWE